MKRTILHRASAALVALVVGAAIAGCTSQVPSLPEDPTPATSNLRGQTTLPTPQASEESHVPNDPSDSDTWVVTTNAIGPVELHSDSEGALREIRRTSIGPVCEGVAYGYADDNAYDIMIIEDREEDTGEVVEISIGWNGDTMGVGPRTLEGLGLGSTKREVLAAYDTAEEQESAIVGRSFVRISNGSGNIVFSYVDGNEGAVSVSVTGEEEPAYEPCA
ncbi:hypothetical protein [Microbacterium amylolyticum]|uniref:Lipoprotein n=1 Tax=Microbacterium amylolyticum TaxID=936337 RepID=A0ABS4ZFY6_9MICO|nr:hypothetical protein [Microbacterium amylolyticum]MBP2436191.1 hypothetical protein [Microbacterium amylolyticum]